MSPLARRVVPLAFAVVLATGACAGSSSSEGYEAEVLGTGEAVALDDLQGQATVLESWATWCKECKELLGELETLHQQRAADGLQVIAVNVNAGNADAKVQEMVDDFGLTMPIWRDPRNDFGSQFRTPGVPTTVLLAADGRVLETWPGGADFDSPEIADAIDAALETNE